MSTQRSLASYTLSSVRLRTQNFLGVLAEAALLAGCLPDPRAYDACVDDDGYYDLPPSGCDGHTLTTLGEVTTNDYLPLSLDSRRVAVDGETVYWVDHVGTLYATERQSGTTETLMPGTSATTLDIEVTTDTLYVMIDGQLYAIDKATHESQTVTTPNALGLFRTFALDGYYYYFGSTTERNCIMRGTLDSEELASCYVSDNSLQSLQGLDESGLYGMDTSRNLVRYAYDSGEPTVLCSSLGFPYDISIAQGYAYYTDCTQTGACTRNRCILEPAGAVEVLVADLGYFEMVTNDSLTTFVIGQGHSDENWSTSRLLEYRPDPAEPTTLAASLDVTVGLTQDADYVFALVTDDVEAGRRTRLLRIER